MTSTSTEQIPQTLVVRVTPRAGSDAIVGWRPGERTERTKHLERAASEECTECAEHTELSVRVSAPPEGGKANAAVIRLLARSLGIPKSALTLLRGHNSRIKTLAFTLDDQSYATWKDSWGNLP